VYRGERQSQRGVDKSESRYKNKLQWAKRCEWTAEKLWWHRVGAAVGCRSSKSSPSAAPLNQSFAARLLGTWVEPCPDSKPNNRGHGWETAPRQCQRGNARTLSMFYPDGATDGIGRGEKRESRSHTGGNFCPYLSLFEQSSPSSNPRRFCTFALYDRILFFKSSEA
jgi:hypothetical protein